MEFFKLLADSLNYDHFEPDSELSTDASGRPELQSLLRLGPQISRMTFYDSVLVIEKLEEPKMRPYRRLLGGVTAPVTDQVRAMSYAPRPQLANLLLAPPTVSAFAPSLFDAIASAREQVGAQRIERDQLCAALEQSRSEGREWRADRDAALAELHRMELALSEINADRDQIIREKDALLDSYNHLHTELAQLSSERLELVARLGALEQFEQRFENIRSSTCWRLTAPLRWLGHRIKGR